MYAISFVRSCNSYADIFCYAVGLFQGNVMSTLMFSLFFEDLLTYLNDNAYIGIYINEINLILFLFTDELAHLANQIINLSNFTYQLSQTYTAIIGRR